VKSFEIDKRLIVEAWEKVRAIDGAPGVDAIGIGLFQERLRGNLYKLWNRMSSGSYFPGAGAGRGDTERSWGGRAFARRADGGGIVP
jgi:retron-type reverse transcriptase